MNSKNRLSPMLLALVVAVSSFGCGGGSATMPPPPPPTFTVTTSSLPNGTVNAPYSVTLQSKGGTPPITWSWSPPSGTALPAGLSLRSDGTISGTPATPGSSCFVSYATDSSTPPQIATQGLCIGINSSDMSHNGLLKGHYAFLMSGFTRLSGLFPVLNTAAGSFDADGLGNLTSGVSDTNISGGVAANQPFTGTYALGSDNRGTMSINDSGGGTETLAFAVGSISSSGVATKGRIINFGTSGAPTAGEFDLQDTTAFSNSAVNGSYAFGFSGWSPIQKQIGVNGVFTSDGAGNFPSGTFDENFQGTLTSQSLTGTYNLATGSTTGRGTGSLTIAGTTLNVAFYVVSASKLLIVSVSADQAVNPLVFMGQALKQSGGTFSNSSLKGTGVLSTVAAVGVSAGGDVTAGLATFDGAGTVTLLQDENNAGAVTSGSTISGTYSVASNGRVTVTAAGSTVLALYLVGPGVAFILNTDPNAGTGFLEAQSAGPFSNSSINGSFFFGDPSPSCCGTPAFSGIAALNAGSVSVTSDIDQLRMPPIYDQMSTDTYTVSSNGRATIGSGNEVIYIVSATKFVVIDVNPSDLPSIKVVEQ